MSFFNAKTGMEIAALGHDIERAIEERKVRREAYKKYDEFKRAHAHNSARIITEIMERCEIEKAVIEDVFNLVSQHETGGGDRSNLLGNADTISFFDVNLPLYRRPLMPHPGEWGWRRLMNCFLFSRPARKGGVVDFTRNTREEVVRRCLWGYRRLAPNLRHFLNRFNYENKEMEVLLKEVIAQIAQEGG